MQSINTAAAPRAIGPYSQAIVADNFAANNLVFASGQIPLNPKNGQLVVSDIKLQTRQVFDNLSAVLAAAESSFSRVTKLNIFLVDLDHFSQVNEIMSTYFIEPYPARSCVQVAALPKGALVEVDAIALGS
jgi:2-iminobutanoate/2-iminopropanoate deaminase